jgi:hypothetical protein
MDTTKGDLHLLNMYTSARKFHPQSEPERLNPSNIKFYLNLGKGIRYILALR